LLADTLPAGEPAADGLTPEQLQPVLAEALRRWEAAGVDTSGLSTLQVQITDLPGAFLGLASVGTILVDLNAAGHGWFIDPPPGDDSEFVTPGDQGEQGRMDLLTVLMHELGHQLGYEHTDGDGLMAETLAPGVRRVPTADVPDVPPAADPLDVVFAGRGYRPLHLSAWNNANLVRHLKK